MPGMKKFLKNPLLCFKKIFSRKALGIQSPLDKILDVNPAVIYRCELSENYPTTFISNNIQEKLGYAPREILNDPEFFIKNRHPDSRERGLLNLKTLSHGDIQRKEYRFRHKNGSYRWLADELKLIRGSDGTPREIIGALTDITERKQMERDLQKSQIKLDYLANHDALTGLPNRRLFRKQLQCALAEAERMSQPVALMFLDLDQLKRVNETLGHSIGDDVLRVVAGRLRDLMQASHTVARLGADEFIIILEGGNALKHLSGIAKRLLDRVSRVITVQGYTLYLSCSIGISFFPDHGTESETLVKRADLAMHQAKQEGGNHFRYYVPEMDIQARELLMMEADLREALAGGQLELHYQPQVDLASGLITGLEALARWRHPRKGYISPAVFIAVAERSNLIVDIGEWAILTACEQSMAWRTRGIAPLRLCINISTRQFKRPDFVNRVADILKKTGLAPQWLELEITESTAMENTRQTMDNLSRLRKAGVHIAIDDFGKGHSSLAYLKHLPITTLKIDKEFVDDIFLEPCDRAVVESTVVLAEKLRLGLVAEGIETARQLHCLREMNCKTGQGFLFSRPLAAEAIEPLLRQGSIDLHALQERGTSEAGQPLA
jgi:diguanylate cyclase (GGDEF)-like protein/PAS domain S-box-containing protein